MKLVWSHPKRTLFYGPVDVIPGRIVFNKKSYLIPLSDGSSIRWVVNSNRYKNISPRRRVA